MISKSNLVLAVFVAALLAGLFVTFGLRPTPVAVTKESFAAMPLDAGGIGPYDGVGGETATVGGSSNKIMFLVDNRVGAEFCPSQLSTDTGCVSLTEQDKLLMARRGGNM